MPQTKIINLSALTELEETARLIPQTIGCVVPDIKRQWLSFEAFLALCDRYAPKPSQLCCSPLSSVYNLGWLVKTYLSNNIIPRYKQGEMDTSEFIEQLYGKFSFLKNVDFLSEVDTVDMVWEERASLISLYGLVLKEELTNELVAKALLEQAWIARMRFANTSKDKVSYFFSKEQETDLTIIVANSNPLDVFHSMRHLKQECPELRWVKDEKLWGCIKRPEESLTQGIQLTTDDSLKLYVSYAHRAFKTGVVPETGTRTDNLIEKLIKAENLDPDDVTLISQWPKDLEMGKELKIANCIDAKSFFNEIVFSKKKEH